MAKLKAIKNHIIFQFTDAKVKHMGVNQFQEKTEGGLIYTSSDKSTSSPRWGKVVCAGPEVRCHLPEGTMILIENLKWTTEFSFGGKPYHRTDTDCLLGIDKEASPAL